MQYEINHVITCADYEISHVITTLTSGLFVLLSQSLAFNNVNFGCEFRCTHTHTTHWVVSLQQPVRVEILQQYSVSEQLKA